jgi:hypothetical protein
MWKRPSSAPSVQPPGRTRIAAALGLAVGATLALAGAAALQAPKKAGPPVAARYRGTEAFQIVLEGDANAFNDQARVTKIEFYPLDGSAMKPDFFEAVGTPRVLLKGRPNAKTARGSRLAVVLRKKSTTAQPAPAGQPIQPQSLVPTAYDAVAGEIIVFVDPDGATGAGAVEPTDPVDVEPMPDPCGPGGPPPVAPDGAPAPAPAKS